MFPFGPDDAAIRPLSEEDHQLLLGLVQRYGIPSLMCALGGGAGESSRASTFSATTLLSSAPSLLSRSDAASIKTQSTWGEAATDMSASDIDLSKPPPERTWLDSPAIQSPPAPAAAMEALQAPRLVAPTSKKYQCPTCYLDFNPVGFGRKSDFKKHLYNFHGADVSWLCRTKGCHLSFATERAYSTHAKEVHRIDALPNSAARTELCPQLVFSCGFATCKEHIFEAVTPGEDAAATRDKYFEHIAKHFEDGFNVADWEYRMQVHNLMRQQRVKPVWKTCIWPKEKRQNLVWRPRSSGDLKRMLECRHLGEDISALVRLAFILGNSPFTAYNTPPPSEIDIHFQLPYRSQCLIDTPGHGDVATAPAPPKAESSTPTFTISKHLSYTPPSVFRLGSRRSKRASRPTTPASMTTDTPMKEDPADGPHPGTPFRIPQDSSWPIDAPKFAPEGPAELPKHTTEALHESLPAPASPPMDAPMEPPIQPIMDHPPPMDMDPPVVYSMAPQDHMRDSWYTINPMAPDPMVPYAAQSDDGSNFYSYRGGNASQTSTVRPATPVPHKRPGSWGRVGSLDNLRASKKATPHDSPYMEPERMATTVPNLYGQELPTSAPMMVTGYELPMRTCYEGSYERDAFEGHHHHHPYGAGPPHMQADAPMTFFFDDGEGRM